MAGAPAAGVSACPPEFCPSSPFGVNTKPGWESPPHATDPEIEQRGHGQGRSGQNQPPTGSGWKQREQPLPDHPLRGDVNLGALGLHMRGWLAAWLANREMRESGCRDPRCSPRGNPACRGTFGALQPTRLLRPWDFPGKSTGVGCLFLLQGIFPTQGSNPGLRHCRQTLYHLSHMKD